MRLRALRLTAIAVAVLGAIDPAVTLNRPAPERLALAIVPSASLALDRGRGTGLEHARRVQAALRARLASRFDITTVASRAARGLVLIGDRAPEALDLADTARVWSVDVGQEIAPNVFIASVDATCESVASNIHIRARIVANGSRGRTSTVRVLAGAIALAEQPHAWQSDRESFDATFDVPPTRSGLALLRVEAVPDAGERSALDNTRTVAVSVGDRRPRLLFFDARPSWSTAFMRRALEADDTFAVSFITQVSRGIAVAQGFGPAPADRRPSAPAPSLDMTALTNADAIVIGAPDALTRADVTTLDRFARSGGAVILMPDRAISGAALALIPGAQFSERLLDQPVSMRLPENVAGPPVSELLVATRLPPLADVIAFAPNQEPLVFKVPFGRGFVYFSGALDAWRRRDLAAQPFARFATNLAREAAASAVPPIAVTLAPLVAPVGESVRIVARVRDASPAFASASAELVAPGGSRTPIRLWPGAEPGTFYATIRPRAIGSHTVHITSGGASTDRTFASTRDADATPARPDTLRLVAASHGGAAYGPEDVDALAQAIESAIPAAHEPRPVHPMRSSWWMVPFAACLSVEWWVRRKRGLR